MNIWGKANRISVRRNHIPWMNAGAETSVAEVFAFIKEVLPEVDFVEFVERDYLDSYYLSNKSGSIRMVIQKEHQLKNSKRKKILNMT